MRADKRTYATKCRKVSTTSRHLERARSQRRAEGVRDQVHVPFRPAVHGVLDDTGVVLNGEAMAL